MSLVYLAGGCDSPNGNRYVEEIGELICESVSDALLAFDLSTESFVDETEIPRMPTPRYRHGSVFVHERNQIWLVGGRDVNDFLVSQVDVREFVCLFVCVRVVWGLLLLSHLLPCVPLNLFTRLHIGLRRDHRQLDHVRYSR